MKNFEEFLDSNKSQFKTPFDIIVSIIHLVFVNDFEYKCLGVGEKLEPERENEIGSESLPKDWNSGQNLYNLIYKSLKTKPDKILLKCIVAGDILVATASPLVPTSSQEIITVSILLNEFVEADILTNQEKFDKFKKSNVESLANYISRMFYRPSSFPRQQPKQQEPKRSGENEVPPPPISLIDTKAQPQSLIDDRLINPPIGGADLDPLGRSAGGGMIFDPFSGNRFRPQPGPNPGPGFPGNPRIIRPPGARYDPIGPLPDARFFHPDPDHFPPPRGPGFDNYFI